MMAIYHQNLRKLFFEHYFALKKHVSKMQKNYIRVTFLTSTIK